MFRRIKLVLQLLFLQLTARSQSIPFDQLSNNNPLQSEFDSILHQEAGNFFKKSGAPGLQIGISRAGEKTFYSYGLADTASKKTWGSKTIFEIGSITKTFVANLIAQLDAKSIINIEKSLADYIPDAKQGDSVLSKIRLRQLLSHISGLPRLPVGMDQVDGYTMMQPYAFYKREQLFSFLNGLRKFSPGKYEYSNLGFGILATIMENETKSSFESLLQKYIWEPLRMQSSYVNPGPLHEDSATGYFYGRPAAYWNFDCMAGAGAIKSNAEDLLKYLDAHITHNNGELSEAIKKVIVPVHRVRQNMQIAMGWHTLEDLKHNVTWHNGGTYGFSTFAAFEPVSQTSIVLVSNATGVNTALEKFAIDLLILLMGK